MSTQTTPSLADATLLRQRQIVPEIVPVSHATLWRWVKKGTFPRPLKCGPNTTVWRKADVLAWVAAQGQ